MNLVTATFHIGSSMLLNTSQHLVMKPHINSLALAQSIFYVISGTLALLSSFLVIFTIAANKVLHTKDFYMLAGLAGADLARGYGYIHGGILRAMFSLTGAESILVTPRQCLYQIYQTFMIFGQKGAAFMIFVLALDRLLAVLMFNRFRTFGAKYALTLVGVAYAVCALVTAMTWLAAFHAMPPSSRVPQLCKTDSTMPAVFYSIEMGFRFVPGLFSALFYCATLLVVNSHALVRAGKMSERERKRQATLTKNVAIVVLTMFIFSTVPYGYVFVNFVGDFHGSDTFNILSPLFYSFSLLGASANLFVYGLNYAKFRAALLKIFCRSKVAPLGPNSNQLDTTTQRRTAC